LITSRFNANIIPLIFCAPKRLNISGMSNATTSAVSVRLHDTAAFADDPKNKPKPATKTNNAKYFAKYEDDFLLFAQPFMAVSRSFSRLCVPSAFARLIIRAVADAAPTRGF
jgi:hypothetical protein